MYSFALEGCSAAIYFSTLSTYPPNGGSAFASATQNTMNVAMYEPSMARGTTFIVFKTTMNNTITTATVATKCIIQPHNTRSVSRGTRLPKTNMASARLAMLLNPPPYSDDNTACATAINQDAS